jgi:hypothetical protein
MAWRSGELYRKIISIHSGQISGNHTNFPLLLKFASDDEIATHASSNGYDFLITTSDGTTRVAIEIEYYSSGTGVLWFNAPSLSHSSQSTFYLYYGTNTNYADDGLYDADNVWNSNYRGVYHLSEESPDDPVDSTSYNNDAIGKQNSPEYQESGIAHKCHHYTDADNDGFLFGSIFSQQNEFTLEAWTNWDGVSDDNQSVITKEDEYYFHYRPTPTRFDWAVHGLSTVSDYEPNSGIWVYYVGTWSASDDELLLYKNGILISSATDTGSMPIDNTDFCIGMRDTHSTYCFGGYIDEVRVSYVPRNPGWIYTTYRNIGLNSTFMTLGHEGVSGGVDYSNYDLKIYYDDLVGNDFVACNCSRWDVNDYGVTVETWLKKSDLQTLRSYITPGAVGELFKILGRPTFFDQTWQGQNTIYLVPNSGSSTLIDMREPKYVYVKNITDSPLPGASGWISVKIEGLVSGSVNL